MIDTLRQKYLENHQDYIEHQTFAAGELIALENDYYWLLQEGAVKTCTWTGEGNAITLGYWGVNDLIGQPLSLVYPYQVKCLTQVKAEHIAIGQTGKIIHLIQRHIQQTEEILYILRSDKAHQRLCRILIWLGQKFGQEVEIGKLIDLRITHQDLAELVGTTRVTITKLINQLEQEHFLSRPQRNTIIIHS
jgi:CRP-like cAMP-binding protein